MEKVSLCRRGIEGGSRSLDILLYELIDAISDEVLPGEEKLVVEVVVNMFNTGKIKFTNNVKFV